MEVAPGVLWLRLALPFALDHVNVYLIEDGAGWAVVDTGLGDDRTRLVWERVIARELGGRPLTRIICTHFHPDHVGQVGWLSARDGLELWMPRTEYYFSMMLQAKSNLDALDSPSHLAFFRRHGLDEAATDALIHRGHAYLKMTTGLPSSFRRIAPGMQIDIGGRAFEVFTGGGHAPEQAMLLCREERLFFAADQVLARISPNISVWAWEPNADPLQDYLHSLAALREAVPEDAFVLAAHNLPFIGLHERIDELARHHAERCARVSTACETPRSAAEIVPFLFKRTMDAHQTGFAFGEALAHINYMLGRDELRVFEDDVSVQRLQAA
jgi:glyoxylase-like metal-dependent hydrolase (beta-lactamase superfamily II)